MRLANATSDWLGDNTSQHAAALDWFVKSPDRDTMRRHWTAIAANKEGVDSVDRGRAVQMVYHLTEPPEYQPRPIASWLRTTGNFEQAGLGRDTWHTAFALVRFADLQLDHSGFSRLAFARNSFHGCNLSSSDLSACHFQAVDISGADFRSSNFAKSNFIGANGAVLFGGSRMHGVTFLGCDFTDASFERCDISGANFLNCTLTRTKFTNAYLGGARFEDCKLDKTVFVNPDVRLEGVWGNMAGIQWVGCRLTGVQFDRADFRSSAQVFYRELSPSPDDFNQDVTIFPRTSENPDARAVPATLEVPASRFRKCELVNVSWTGTMLTGDVFDETTWQQLPAEVRDNLAREVTSDEAFAQLLEG